MLPGDLQQPTRSQTGVVRQPCRLKQFGQIGIGLLEGRDLPGRSHPRTQDEPGDRAVVGTGRADHRLIGIFRVLANLLESGVDLQHHRVQVGTHAEFQRDSALRVHALGRHLGNALDPLELLLLL